MTKKKEYDRSIAYKALLTKLENRIAELKAAKVETSSLERIKESIEKKVEDALNPGRPNLLDEESPSIEVLNQEKLELIYGDAITELEKALESSKAYTVYIEVNNQSKTIQDTIDNPNIQDDDVTHIANLIIKLIKSINSSNTRDYRAQESIINNLYNLAYQIIKLEFMYKGKSIVLSWAATDEIASGFMNEEVYKEIQKCRYEGTDNKTLETIINQAKSDNIEIPYLDEKVILYLLLNSGYSQDIKKRIENILIDINNNLAKISRSKSDEEAAKERITVNLKDRKHYIKTLIAYVGVCAMLVVGSHKASKIIEGRRYNYDVNSYTTGDMLQTEVPEEYDSYQKNSLRLYEYQPWTETDKGYARQYDVLEKAWYSLGEPDVTTSEELATVLFESDNKDESLAKLFEFFEESDYFKRTSHTETRETLSPDDRYDEIIREAVKVQRGNFAFIDEQEASLGMMLLILGISYAILFGGSALIESETYTELIITAIKAFKEKNMSKKDLESNLAWQEHIIAEYAIEHSNFRTQFVELYEKFISVLSNERTINTDLQDAYNRIKTSGDKAYLHTLKKQ